MALLSYDVTSHLLKFMGDNPASRKSIYIIYLAPHQSKNNKSKPTYTGIEILTSYLRIIFSVSRKFNLGNGTLPAPTLRAEGPEEEEISFTRSCTPRDNTK